MGDVDRADVTPADIRKSIRVISVMLGLMLAAALVLIVKAFVKGDVNLVAVLLPTGFMSVLLIANLVRLRKKLAATESK